jgi:protein-L-isoaspartate(D-aspartate) O-methyltransferase
METGGAMPNRANLDEVRAFFAKMMAAASGTDDPRYERAFELVRREAFLGPGPWHALAFAPVLNTRPHYLETPSADPVYLYQNLLFALDVAKRINNGEPFLHAGWLGSVSPKPGEAVCHIGAGTGYYSAILSVLTLPGGAVKAFEIDENLAHKARRNLEPFENVSVTTGDATRLPLPPSDLIYVNAGVVAPPPSWLRALRQRGRMIFPWRPSETVALTLMLTRAGEAFTLKALGPSWFIPCVGASNEEECIRIPDSREAWSTRSAWLTADREPDQTAVAIYRQMWFSSTEIPAEP